MADIFISYKSEDWSHAQEFARAFEKMGISVWWDRKIPLGKSFDRVIEEELTQAKCVVVLWSKFSVVSDWVKDEAAAGAERGVLLPILIDSVSIPLGFGRIQAASLIDWKGDTEDPEFSRVRESVRSMVGLADRDEVDSSLLIGSVGIWTDGLEPQIPNQAAAAPPPATRPSEPKPPSRTSPAPPSVPRRTPASLRGKKRPPPIPRPAARVRAKAPRRLSPTRPVRATRPRTGSIPRRRPLAVPQPRRWGRWLFVGATLAGLAFSYAAGYIDTETIASLPATIRDLATDGKGAATTALEELADSPTGAQALDVMESVRGSLGWPVGMPGDLTVVDEIAYLLDPPGRSEATGRLEELQAIVRAYATVPEASDFVTCKSVIEDRGRAEAPLEISRRFSTGDVYIFARLHAPRQSESVTLRWLDSEGRLQDEQAITVRRNTSSGSRIFGFRTYDQPGEYEVRLYNEANALIGRLDFSVVASS